MGKTTDKGDKGDKSDKSGEGGDAPTATSASASKRAKQAPVMVTGAVTKKSARKGKGVGPVFQRNNAELWRAVGEHCAELARTGGTAHTVPPLNVATASCQLRPSAQQAVPQVVPLSRAEQRYLESQPAEVRLRILQALQAGGAPATPLRFRVSESNLPPRIKTEILNRLAASCCDSKYEAYVEKALTLPLGKYSPPLALTSSVSQWIQEARTLMDDAMYGQHTVKDEVVRMLCQFKSSGATRPFALALQGPPGIGKTSFVQNALAPVLKRPFTFISLGGASDGAMLAGHSYTYEGSQCGALANSLIDHGVMDGVFFFDELDKVSETSRGQEVSNILLHLTDRVQNDHFGVDKYFSGIEFDFSRSIFIFSYNDERPINPVLLNRMNVIKFDCPSDEDKLEIAKRHLFPRALEAAGLDPNPEKSLSIPDEVMREIIKMGPREPGLRGLEKSIGRIVDTCNVLANQSGRHLRTLGEDLPESIQLPFKLSMRIVNRCISCASSRDAPPPLMYC